MQVKLLAPLALAGLAYSQALTDVIAQTPELSILGALLLAYPGVASTLAGASNITILAPSNTAFANFLTADVNASIAADAGLVPAVLSYHVLSSTIHAGDITDTPAFPKTLLTNSTYTNVTGGQVVKAAMDDGGNVVFTTGLLSESVVTTADVAFTGGVVHIIDKVLTIPTSPSNTAAAANLTSLVDALTATNLVSTLDSAKDITVFAPSNSGFQAIANLVSALSVDQISTILQYHVVAGTVGYSSTLANNTQLATLQTGSVTVTINGGSIFINQAEVQVADVLIANGVAHVIDNVLNPGNSTATVSPNATTGTPAFSGASTLPNPTTTPMTAAAPRQTAAIGAAALFGGAALFGNF